MRTPTPPLLCHRASGTPQFPRECCTSLNDSTTQGTQGGGGRGAARPPPPKRRQLQKTRARDWFPQVLTAFRVRSAKPGQTTQTKTGLELLTGHHHRSGRYAQTVSALAPQDGRSPGAGLRVNGASGMAVRNWCPPLGWCCTGCCSW